MQIGSMRFSEVWFVDFEFISPPGEKQIPVCLVAHEFDSGHFIRIWKDELGKMSLPPYAIHEHALFVAYYASAEIGCHLALGWPLPENVLDLFTEFRNMTNGYTLPCGNSLLGALVWYGLRGIDAAEKNSMRELVQRGGPWTPDEKSILLSYCETDVKSLNRLLSKMLPVLDLSRALLRGRYMKAAARIENCGVPIDVKKLNKLNTNWDHIQDSLIADIDSKYGVFEGRTFKEAKFAYWLKKNDIPWPLLDSGKPDLKDATFRDMANSYPELQPLRELRISLSQMRLSNLAVGGDGRNRCLLSAFRARTGRNQPSNSRFIFGPAIWLRGLIQPEPGFGLAYIDWSQQEFGIAAVLSGDMAMLEAYESGDPYLAFAMQAGAAPPDATKKSHRNVRNQFKACALAVQYGMGPLSLARRINQPAIQAIDLLRFHHETYRKFWKWSDGVVDYAMLKLKLYTVFGWTVYVGPNSNPRFLRNFPMQANGAEMLRIACCLTTEQGVSVCAPVHDALLIEAPLDELGSAILITQKAMSDASAEVLNGFRLRTDVKVIRYPDRYSDRRGKVMWDTVNSILSSPLRPI